MPYTLIITAAAHKDTTEAYIHYEKQQKGLGERFLTSLSIRYNDLSDHPTHYSFIEEDNLKIFRDCLLYKFPYVVVFEIRKKEVVIYAIHNTYKNPDKKIRKI